MGFLGDLWEIASDLWESTKEWVHDKVEDIKEFFDLGSRESYSGSVQETVDIDKVLNDFRTSISPEAKELEGRIIDSVLAKFDSFIESEGHDYPELVSALKKKKRSVASHLNGIIVNHINKRASTNDEEFRKILEMQPGAPKTQALKTQSKKFLAEAESLFKEKLQSEMADLNTELSDRFREALKSQEEQLESKARDYKRLLEDAERGQLDLNALEEDCVLIADACSCMDDLFTQMESKL